LGGTLTMGSVSESSTTSDGTVGWTYTVADSETDYLAAGQTTTESFTVTIDDGQGGTTTQTVTITVSGHNEDPTITAAGTNSTGTGTEDAGRTSLTTTGTNAFNDVDLIDTHTPSGVKNSGTLGGTLTMGSVSESSTTSDGTVGWTYTVADSATDYLSPYPTLFRSFTVTIDDGQGGTTTQTVTITVSGHNEDPTITAAGTNSTGLSLHDALTICLTTTGTIAFNDVDLIDIHTPSVVK